MTEQTFKLGQRWISNTEPELGLGMITDNENRRVTVHFPAAGERRTYASDNAPVNRVIYEVGDEIANIDKHKITITQVEEEQGYIIYAGVDDSGEPRIIPELELNSFVQFNRPQDRLFAGQIDKLKYYNLRYQSLTHQARLYHNRAQGLLGARVQLLPHQMHIAGEVANRFAPRVLLADEVGLGKTIEAGLIIHHQLLTGRAQRVLIAVPDSLVHQWLVEMRRRFNLSFTLLDERRCEALSPEADNNPFTSTQLVICSLGLLCNSDQRLQQALKAQWDLMVVDEAHHLHWTADETDPAGDGYRRVATLANITRGLLLLTATPEQLGEESHFARLRLLDPDRYFDFDKYREEEAGYKPANDLVQHLLADDVADRFAADPALKKTLTDYVGKQRADALLDALLSSFKLSSLKKSGEAQQQAIDDCVNHLLDHHGTGRVLFRNTRGAVKGFPERQLHPHRLPAPEGFDALAKDAEPEAQLHPEQLLGDNWLQQDPRINWLTDWLKQHRREKVLLICHRHETALELEDYLRLRKGVLSTAFHEELSLIERDRAAAYFADDIDGAQLLVCSEIGSEGRNFQFAHHLVLFDLPLNPDLLEQRIGRLARIGQQNTVQIHVPFYDLNGNGATERLLDWFHRGINAIEHTCPAAQTLFQTHEAELRRHLCGADADTWEAFIQRSRQETDTLLQTLAEGRDQLLELNSCNRENAAQIIDAIDSIDADPALPHYMRNVFDIWGVDEDHHSRDSIVLHPTDHMHGRRFPGLPDEGLTATYNRPIALGREDMEFLTWEHPMVRDTLDMIVNNEQGNNALGTIKLPPLKPGSLLVETVFSIHCAGPARLQLNSYFDQNLLRFLRSDKQDLSNVIGFDQLSKLHTPAPNKKTAQGIVKHAKADILALLNQCQAEAEQQQLSLIGDALTRMDTQQQAELTRLRTLADINPNIRPEEIRHLESNIAELTLHIKQAQIRLEMVRVIVCT